MFRKEEKKALTRLALLSIGWPAGLDRFYEGKARDGILSIIGWCLVFGSIMLLAPCPSTFQGGSGVSEMIPRNPFVIIPLAFGVVGAVLVLRKAFHLLRQFEQAGD